MISQFCCFFRCVLSCCSSLYPCCNKHRHTEKSCSCYQHSVVQCVLCGWLRERAAEEKVHRKLSGNKCTVQVTISQFINAAASQHQEPRGLVCSFSTAGKVKGFKPEATQRPNLHLRVLSAKETQDRSKV